MIITPEQLAKTGSEHGEQAALMQWISLYGVKQWPELKLMFAIPNGGDRRPSVAANLKAEGVKPGIPDLMLPVARGGFFGLFVEMKRVGGDKPRPEQKWWHEKLMYHGYSVWTCYGWEEAVDVLKQYLSKF